MTIKNPWLEISYSDYVNHMRSLEVGQYQMINNCFKEALHLYNPRTIFVPGCTIGNGFEHIDWEKIKKVTALDINKEYLKVLRQTYQNEKLEIVNGDILDYDTYGQKFDLIFCALLFEYVVLKSAIIKLKDLMDSNTHLYVILQKLNVHQEKITKTKYKSLEKLKDIMHLINYENFENIIIDNSLCIKNCEELTLNSGKSFYLIDAKLAL